MKLIMESWRKFMLREGEELHEVTVYKGVYVTSRDPFRKAVMDMVSAVESNDGDVQAALTTIEQNVDRGAYSSAQLRQLIASSSYGAVRGLYATTRDKFLEAMADAGELAKLPHESAFSIASQIERRVDQGKYSDPRVRSMMREQAKEDNEL